MKKFYLSLLVPLIFITCEKQIDYSKVQVEDVQSENFDPALMEINDNEDVETYHDATGEYPDGTYCAEVEYYNSTTGTRSSYDLDVEVESGDLVRIDWPNGGWLDETHFSPDNISTGEVSFTSDRGYQYTVNLGDFGGGCTGGSSLQSTINSDIVDEKAEERQRQQDEEEIEEEAEENNEF